MAKIQTFELDRWSEPDENHRVKHIGMADAKETFDKLKTHLEMKGLLPDEYFSFSGKYEGLTGELPEFEEALCIPNFGSSEGIYLDISLACRDSDGKRYFQSFATGKTLLSSALEKFAGAPCTAIQTITCHGRDDYAVWNVEIPSDMFRSIVREAAEKVGTLEELMDSMDPTSGYEMRLLTQMKDGRFAFFTIPERMNALRDYETQGSSTRGDKEQIMAEIFTDWEPAEEPEDELER